MLNKKVDVYGLLVSLVEMVSDIDSPVGDYGHRLEKYHMGFGRTNTPEEWAKFLKVPKLSKKFADLLNEGFVSLETGGLSISAFSHKLAAMRRDKEFDFYADPKPTKKVTWEEDEPQSADEGEPQSADEGKSKHKSPEGEKSNPGKPDKKKSDPGEPDGEAS